MSSPVNTAASDVPALESTKRITGDVISDEIMAELARRLKLTGSPNGDSSAGTLSFGGNSVSDASGNQIVSRGNGLFVPLGAGLSVAEGNGLSLNADNQIVLSRRIFKQVDTISADGTKTFTLPTQVANYAVIITAFGDPGATARWWVSNRTSTAVTIQFAGYSTTYNVETTITELPA